MSFFQHYPDLVATAAVLCLAEISAYEELTVDPVFRITK
jgi:hypothetical protein